MPNDTKVNVDKIINSNKVDRELGLTVGFKKMVIDGQTINKIVVSYKDKELFSLKLDYTQKKVIDSLIQESDYIQE